MSRVPECPAVGQILLDGIPVGETGSGDLISITEHRGHDLNQLGERGSGTPSPTDPCLRVVINRTRWLALAPAFWEEANRRLRANGLPTAKFQKKPPSKPSLKVPSSAKSGPLPNWKIQTRRNTRLGPLAFFGSGGVPVRKSRWNKSKRFRTRSTKKTCKRHCIPPGHDHALGCQRSHCLGRCRA